MTASASSSLRGLSSLESSVANHTAAAEKLRFLDELSPFPRPTRTLYITVAAFSVSSERSNFDPNLSISGAV